MILDQAIEVSNSSWHAEAFAEKIKSYQSLIFDCEEVRRNMRAVLIDEPYLIV